MKTQTSRHGKLELLDLEVLAEAAECLKTLAHPHRLRMVQMLLHGRYTVGELAAACEIPSPQASGHLRLLQHCGLLEQDREGREVYYRVAQPCLKDILGCIRERFADGIKCEISVNPQGD
ncbi:MAG: winged helix-turn-helix transcriptional regulator [Pirellulales bacterium]|nr:winged helix-turn-helix transcriptional regulator [Pirellulales bacterium]